jgi:hypothetical protein
VANSWAFPFGGGLAVARIRGSRDPGRRRALPPCQRPRVGASRGPSSAPPGRGPTPPHSSPGLAAQPLVRHRVFPSRRPRRTGARPLVTHSARPRRSSPSGDSPTPLPLSLDSGTPEAALTVGDVAPHLILGHDQVLGDSLLLLLVLARHLPIATTAASLPLSCRLGVPSQPQGCGQSSSIREESAS